MTTLFFATDVHGSDICWNKFINAGKFYNADVIILGGDMTGKAIVPIVHNGNNTYRTTLLQQDSILHGEEEVQAMIKKIKSRGYYPYKTTPDEISELTAAPEKVTALFKSEVLKTAQRWMEYADEKLKDTHIRCFVAPGNDDTFELDGLIQASRHIILAEGRVVDLDDHHQMISSGWSNPTPWHTYREENEDGLLVRYETMAGKLKNPRTAVFNFHVPPYASTLDDAPELSADLRPKFAGNSLVPVGSKSGRAVIQKYQPLLGLFGHIHESKGAVRIGKTQCINPGSMYEQGVLLGALIQLEKGRVKNYIFTNG
ncbi:MAG: metallophosphoesterase [Anaerolineaceae bacterium]|nr:metallophosphoesterase [Anaerolineaceae bacterium]